MRMKYLVQATVLLVASAVLTHGAAAQHFDTMVRGTVTSSFRTYASVGGQATLSLRTTSFGQNTLIEDTLELQFGDAPSFVYDPVFPMLSFFGSTSTGDGV